MHVYFLHACVWVNILDQFRNILSVNHLICKFTYVVHGIGHFVESEADVAHYLEFAEEFEVPKMLYILHGKFEHAQILEEGCNYELPLLQTLICKDEAYLEA
jgi:hypothetical protein